jgi:hypothetical protein
MAKKPPKAPKTPAPEPGPSTPPPATGGGILASAGAMAPPIRLANGQIHMPPGSNGGVHRGPDKNLRRNVIAAIFLKALAAEGLSLEELQKARKNRTAPLVPWAMLQHCVRAFQNIAQGAAAGNPYAYGPFLRMMADAHEIMQPAAGDKDNGHHGQARPVKFVYTDAAGNETRVEVGPSTPAPADGMVDADGQEYVSG